MFKIIYKLKIKLVFISLMVLLGFPSIANTESVYKGYGYIEKIGAIPSRSDADFIFVKGFSNAGSCSKAAGFVIVRFPNGKQGDRSYNLALAAKMANKKVNIAVDGSNKSSSGNCFIHSISIE